MFSNTVVFCMDDFPSDKQKRPKPFGSGRTKLSVVPPDFGKIPHSGRKRLSRITVGFRCSLLLPFQPNAPGRLLRQLHRNSHQPFPLFASTRRILLPILAVSNILLQYIIPFFECQESRQTQYFLFQARDNPLF